MFNHEKWMNLSNARRWRLFVQTSKYHGAAAVPIGSAYFRSFSIYSIRYFFTPATHFAWQLLWLSHFLYFSHKVCGQTIEQLFSRHRIKNRKEFKSPFPMLFALQEPQKKSPFGFIGRYIEMWGSIRSHTKYNFPFFFDLFSQTERKTQFLIKFHLKWSYFVHKKRNDQTFIHWSVNISVCDTTFVGANFFVESFCNCLSFFYIINCSLPFPSVTR